MKRSICQVLAGVLLLAAPGAVRADDSLPPPSKGPVDFTRDIQPILAAHCIACHGPQKQKGGLRLHSAGPALEGGDSGPSFEPGNSEESLLIEKVAGLDEAGVMPPKGDRLTSEEIGKLRAWIDQGARWPDGLVLATEPPVPKHWSFQAPVRPDPPRVEHRAWARNEIDRFVLAKLEAEGVLPAPEAQRSTLIRRLSIDLLGLPPTPDEVASFLADTRPDHYERLVDRLLASPHFGERWGRHWLDLARYADSDGYEKDSPRPFAYRYRDWVIEAFNRDLPFDQFTIEQLAGDLLPNPTIDQRVATGFHRNTLTNKEGGVDQEEFRVAAIVDRVNTTGTVWLGLTVGCAQCHTHKYDPITQREYYGLFAFFNSSDEVDLGVPPRPEDRAAYDQAMTKHEAALAKARKALENDEARQRPARQTRWEASFVPATAKDVPSEVLAILAIPPDERTEADADKLADYHRSIDEESRRLKARVDALLKKAPRLESKAPTLAERPGGRPTHLLVRGDFLRPGDEVTPGTPAFLPALERTGAALTRLDLACWLVDESNPLCARVEVNRTWEHLLGRALVTSMGDFGLRGEPPTHGALLDWLATEYPRRGWSRKALIKLIVTSATYRQSSRNRPELVDRDPNNEWLARQNRYRPEAEIVRDLFLDTGGLLTREIGGPSVRPPQPEGISELTYANSAKWVVSTGADRYRRGLYTWFQRTSPFPMLMTFDAPDANVCLVKRDRSDTPLQALTLLNDATFVECAQGLAARVLDSCDAFRRATTEGRLRDLYRLALGRDPTAEEMPVLQSLHDSLLDQAEQAGPAAEALAGRAAIDGVPVAEAAAWVALARTVMNLDEFVTRE